jgi:hypothetical protein
MAETALTVQTVVGPYPASVAANDLDVTWTAADAANGNKFSITGREIILFKNDDVGAQTVTFTSQLDPQNRTQHITAYSLGAAETGAFKPALVGWANGSGEMLMAVSDANIFFAILRY